MGVLVVVVLVTGGKQSQLLVRLTWTGMDLDWSLTKKDDLHIAEMHMALDVFSFAVFLIVTNIYFRYVIV